MAPGLVQRIEPPRRFHIGRLACCAPGLVILAPFRPLQLLLAGGGEFGRAHIGRREPVFPARPDRHERLAGEDAVAQQLALERLGVQRYPQLQPAVADEFEYIRLFRALAGGLDDQLRRTAVGQQAQPVIAPSEPCLVQQGIGRIGIVGRPALPDLFVVERASRKQAVVAGEREPEIDDLVDFLPVEAERQRPAHPAVPEQGPPDGVGGIEVRVKRRMRALARAPEADLVAARLLAALQEGHIVEPEIARLEIAGAGGGLRRYEAARGNVHHHAVDIGKLAAAAVDAVVKGVAGEEEAVGRRAGQRHPGLQGRQVRIVVLVLAVELVVQRSPASPARLFHGPGQFLRRRMGRVEALQVVRRAVDVERPRAGQRGQEPRIGRRPAVADGPVVQHFEEGRFAVNQHRRRRSGR